MRVLPVVLMSLFFLTACQTSPPVREVVRYQTLALTPPDELLVECPIAAPPKPADYVLLKTWSDKEGILMATIASHMQAIGTCNIRFEKLRQWKTAVLKAVSAVESASAPVVVAPPEMSKP